MERISAFSRQDTRRRAPFSSERSPVPHCLRGIGLSTDHRRRFRRNSLPRRPLGGREDRHAESIVLLRFLGLSGGNQPIVPLESAPVDHAADTGGEGPAKVPLFALG